MPLFGQLLIAFYQEDIVEEDDIQAWHKTSNKPIPHTTDAIFTENMQKCFKIGAQMIKQLAEQDDESESGWNVRGQEHDLAIICRKSEGAVRTVQWILNIPR